LTLYSCAPCLLPDRKILMMLTLIADEFGGQTTTEVMILHTTRTGWAGKLSRGKSQEVRQG
jgi:hypothetical protein